MQKTEKGSVSGKQEKNEEKIGTAILFGFISLFLFCAALNLLNPYNMVATLSGHGHMILYLAMRKVGLFQSFSILGAIVSLICCLFNIFITLDAKMQANYREF